MYIFQKRLSLEMRAKIDRLKNVTRHILQIYKKENERKILNRWIICI